MALAKDPYYWSRDMMNIQNQRALTGSGRQFSPDEISGVVGANFAAQQQNEVTQTQLQLQKDQMTLQQNAANEAQHENTRNRANAAIMGTAQLALNAPLAYLGYKSIFGGGAAATTTTGAGAADAAVSSDLAVGSGYTSQAAVTGGTATEVTTAGGAEAGVSGEGAVAGGSMALPVAGAAATLGISAAATNWAVRELGGSSKDAQIGGIAGAVLPVFTAPIIAVAAAKEIIDKTGHPHMDFGIGSSIICTELNRQGLLDRNMMRTASICVTKHWNEPDNREFYQGYLIFASPIVEKMKKSKLITRITKPYGTILCREVASRESEKYKSTIMSRFVYRISCKMFRYIYANYGKGGGLSCL